MSEGIGWVTGNALPISGPVLHAFPGLPISGYSPSIFVFRQPLSPCSRGDPSLG